MGFTRETDFTEIKISAVYCDKSFPALGTFQCSLEDEVKGEGCTQLKLLKLQGKSRSAKCNYWS